MTPTQAKRYEALKKKLPGNLDPDEYERRCQEIANEVEHEQTLNHCNETT